MFQNYPPRPLAPSALTLRCHFNARTRLTLDLLSYWNLPCKFLFTTLSPFVSSQFILGSLVFISWIIQSLLCYLIDFHWNGKPIVYFKFISLSAAAGLPLIFSR
ncbi:hypothetical protein K2173_004535 [Erythroxylum novogranatense]|uniref:Uncharacterized protein n=1 Tax=Erythroxylum novogranatense TaxID=1862640 RepID=A0AAV8T4M2_9ROSI|nr:hypothetical protein K2173_004535 [Erythroxylum novogranatense]